MARQESKWNVLLRFHSHNDYLHAPECIVATLAILFHFEPSGTASSHTRTAKTGRRKRRNTELRAIYFYLTRDREINILLDVSFRMHRSVCT